MLYPTDGDMPLARDKDNVSRREDEDSRYDEAMQEYSKALEAEDKEGCDRARFRLSQLGREAGFVRP